MKRAIQAVTLGIGVLLVTASPAHAATGDIYLDPSAPASFNNASVTDGSGAVFSAVGELVYRNGQIFAGQSCEKFCSPGLNDPDNPLSLRLGDATSVAVDPTGDVYIDDRGATGTTQRVWKVAPSGHVTAVDLGACDYMTESFGMVADSVGNLFIASAGNYMICEIPVDGPAKQIIGDSSETEPADGDPAVASYVGSIFTLGIAANDDLLLDAHTTDYATGVVTPHTYRIEGATSGVAQPGVALPEVPFAALLLLAPAPALWLSRRHLRHGRIRASY